MNYFKNNIITLLMVVIFTAITTCAQDAKVGVLSVTPGKSIEVARFDIKEGVEFPVPSLDVMTNEIVDELIKLKKFSSVKLAAPVIPAAPDSLEKSDSSEIQLLLTGTVMKYQPGNRATRYFIGLGAGKTKVVAAIKITDKVTGKFLFGKDVDGKVVYGVFGGNSNGATRGLAKEVAQVTKKALFK